MVATIWDISPILAHYITPPLTHRNHIFIIIKVFGNVNHDRETKNPL